MNYASRFLAVILVIQIGGCAYEPKLVEASRPLVNPSVARVQLAMPADLQHALNTLPQGATINTGSITFTLGQRYISALGLECIELLADSYQGHSQRSAACKSEKLWYQVPQLEQTAVGDLLAEQ
ncbi:hypothetical protein [Aeromonas hydrophila]|uniref:hypothetical protein n=1 Tax=Aeromonas hydrophila TaxID=644 RepID=UPI0009BB6589|nr:hypothetical protein [Aeromonas hydrophila]